MAILAIGGTGQVGCLVVERLAARGFGVRVLTRDPAKVRLPEGVTAVAGDVLDAAVLRRALHGVKTVFLLNPVAPDETTRALLTIELAAQAGVAGIVYLSMVNADVLPDVPHAVAKHAAERLIIERGLPATVLRPNYFMQNDIQLREPLLDGNVYAMPIGHVGAAMVDARDIADTAAHEIGEREHATTPLPHRLIDVSGPDVLTASDLCAIWTDALGRPISYAGDDLEPFEQRVAAHVPSAMALDVALMFRAWQRIGVLPKPGAADALSTMLGRPLRTYRQFAAECAAEWSPGTAPDRQGAGR